MTNIPPIKPRNEIKTEVISDVTKAWKIGQVLNATVTRGGYAQDTVQIRIGKTNIDTKTPVTLKTGDHIQLVVKQLGTEILLGIKAEISTRDASIYLLRQYINNLQDIKPLINTVEKILASTSALTEIKPVLQQLITSIPDLKQVIDHQQLKSQIRNSGVYMESRLLNIENAQQLQSIKSNDLKHQLLTIKQLIDNQLKIDNNLTEPRSSNLEEVISKYIKGELTIKQLGHSLASRLPIETVELLLKQLQSSQLVSLSTKDIFYPVIEPLINHIRIQPDGKSLADALISVLVKSPLINELKSNIDSLINKVINQQLLPLTKDADSPNFILFDLPVKHNKEITLFQFRIDEEKNKNKMKKPVWTVSINFEFEELGAIQTKISLQDNNISTLFHAEKETTANRINRNIPQLKSNLEIAGFKVTNIDVLENKIQQPRNLPRDIHFLDEKA